MSNIWGYEASVITYSLFQSSDPPSYYSPDNRVLVKGLQNNLEYNGLEGVISKIARDSRIYVRLDQGHKELRLKLENVRPLIVTAEQRKEQLGSKVLLEELRNQPEYNGLQGKVIDIVGDSHICVCLDRGKRELRLKRENAHPLFVTAE